VLAAARRDGAAVAAALVTALLRLTKKPDSGEDVEYSKGMRVLSTIAAYAATYTSGDKDSEEAHGSRTELLESLTKDMTVRTNRGDDWIWSVGGSLRLVGGMRLSRKAENVDRGTAFWAPISIPLGFGLDRLFETSKNHYHLGLHAEIGVFDLGQYLAFEEGLKLAEPDLGDAFSPSLTLAIGLGWELPIIIGATIGYTPSFDFDSTKDDKLGAINLGVTVGGYVPLFDFN
jgi:hypothetical protein